MTFTNLYLKLIHVSSSPKENFTSPAERFVPYITSSMGPLVAGTPAFSLTGLLAANTTTLAGPLNTYAYNTTPTVPLTTKDDYYGAMLFTVATVCVYGLSIVFFIAGHMQKRNVNKDEEQQISSYLKRLYLDEPSQEDRKFHVIRLKSQLLAASALGQRHNRRMSLIPRLFGTFVRRGEERVDEGSDSGDDEDLEEKKASRPSRALLCNGECRVQSVNEQPMSKVAVPAPFRGRRFGCVGFGMAARPGDRGTEGPRESVESGKMNSQRPPLLPCSLPSIEEDEISMHSLTDLLSSQPQGHAEIRSPDLEDPEPNVSPETPISPGGSFRDSAQPPSYSEAIREQSESGSNRPVDNEPCGVMVTRL